MLVFWQKGYEATSIRDLKGQMGISSSSMYEFLGDKHSVYLKVLERYCQIEQARLVALADQIPSPQAYVETLFTALETVAEGPGGQGSFSFKAMVELGSHDRLVAQRLLAHYQALAEIVSAVLRRADPPLAVDPDQAAQTVLVCLYGTAALLGAGADARYRPAITATVLTLLAPPATHG